MQDNNQASLSPHVIRFFKSQTDNKDVIDLVVKIQQGLEKGHSCVRHEEVIENELISQNGDSGYIVHNDGKAGFRRFYNQENYIREEFSQLTKRPIDFKQLKNAVNQVKEISNTDKTEEIDLQWQASLAFLLYDRFILSGGPGTGKTTTVIRLMLLYKFLYPENKIALAAPTGKAANRLNQSINANIVALNLQHEISKNLSTTAQTMHRLLGYNPQTNTLRFNENSPLPYDLLIIDEASMLDISMTYALLKAIKPKAQLILIGDKNQLPAVEAGNVFADLCNLLQQNKQAINLLEQVQQGHDINHSNIANYVELEKNYRFEAGSVIAKLSQALINKDTQHFKSYQSHNSFDWNTAVLNKEDKQSILKKWYHSIPKDETAILLSATNFGENSVNELNKLAMGILYGDKLRSESMPIMVTKNDYTLNIFNGDIGYLHYVENQWQVKFIINGEQQYIQLDAIHQWQVAHAISIHKSQGSEYDHILIAIPDDFEKELLTNQLLYTAITRAKTSVTLWASENIMNKIIDTDAKRLTFLN